ncbi:MAG TPA: cytochrome b, partial [Pseudoxanthomonas sp.]|nr:cytochrome b [Pseudoxanthomonas sp.]
MKLRSDDRHWGGIAKSLHWIVALAILGNGVFGLCMDLASNPMQKINWLALHKSIGLTVLAL